MNKVSAVHDKDTLRGFYYGELSAMMEGKHLSEVPKLLSKSDWDKLNRILYSPGCYRNRTREDLFYNIKQFFDNEARVIDLCKNL